MNKHEVPEIVEVKVQNRIHLWAIKNANLILVLAIFFIPTWIILVLIDQGWII